MASKVAVVTYLLIAANVLVYFTAIYNQPEPDIIDLFAKYGLTPVDIMRRENLFTLVTSMFLHADLLHLGMNMLFLLIAGDGVEREIGGVGFLILYLVCGVLAGLFHVYMNEASSIPAIGASGAIFGILAAFAVLFPFRWLITLFGLIPVPMPAIVFVSIAILSETALATSGAQDYVAHYAHLGGFLAGVFLTLLFGPRRRKPEEITEEET